MRVAIDCQSNIICDASCSFPPSSDWKGISSSFIYFIFSSFIPIPRRLFSHDDMRTDSVAIEDVVLSIHQPNFVNRCRWPDNGITRISFVPFFFSLFYFIWEKITERQVWRLPAKSSRAKKKWRQWKCLVITCTSVNVTSQKLFSLLIYTKETKGKEKWSHLNWERKKEKPWRIYINWIKNTVGENTGLSRKNFHFTSQSYRTENEIRR